MPGAQKEPQQSLKAGSGAASGRPCPQAIQYHSTDLEDIILVLFILALYSYCCCLCRGGEVGVRAGVLLQASRIQPATLEPGISSVLEAAAERGADEWDGGMRHQGNKPCAQQH